MSSSRPSPPGQSDRDSPLFFLQQQPDVARQDLLARLAELLDVGHEIADMLAPAHLLRIVGGEHDSRGRQLGEPRIDRADRAAEPRGVEDHVVVDVVVEILGGLAAVLGAVLHAPEVLVLVAADARHHAGDAAAEMRHVHDELRMAVEHAGVDQADGRHHQREFAADRARGVVAVELLRIVELQRRMHEHEQAELLGLGPERLKRRIVDELAIHLRRDDYAGRAELLRAAVEFAERLRPAEPLLLRFSLTG